MKEFSRNNSERSDYHIDYDDFTNLSFLLLGNFTLPEFTFEPVHHSVWSYLFWVTFAVGFIGNGLVIYVFCRNKRTRTVTNAYLLNLAIVDMFYLIATVPYNTSWMSRWPFGGFVCKFLGFLMNVTMILGILTLTAVGVDRHNAVLYPVWSRSHRTIRRTILAIATFWLFSCAACSPTFAIAQSFDIMGHEVCVYIWPEKWIYKVYTTSSFVLLYALPQLILAICYSRIGHRLWISPNTTTLLQGSARRKVRNVRRVVKMSAIVTVTFMICWFPIYVLELLLAYGTEFSAAVHELKALAPLLPHFCIAANPFIYNFMSKTFHNHLKSAIACFVKSPELGRKMEGHSDERDDPNLCVEVQLNVINGSMENVGNRSLENVGNQSLASENNGSSNDEAETEQFVLKVDSHIESTSL